MNVLNAPKHIKLPREVKTPLQERKLVALLNTLITSYLMIECLDELRDTGIYRREVKKKGNLFEEEIKKIANKDLDELWVESGDNDIMDFIEGVKHFIRQFATVRPEHMTAIGLLVEKYQEMPEWTLHVLGLLQKQKVA